MLFNLKFITIFFPFLLALSCSNNERNSVFDKLHSEGSKGKFVLDTSGLFSLRKIDSCRTASSQSMDNLKRIDYKSVYYYACKSWEIDWDKWLEQDRMIYSKLHPGRISPYDKIIKKMARRYGFDWRLIAAQIYVESNFKTDATSLVGANGLMQLMPSTAKFLGYKGSKLTDPETNIWLGCLYDQRMYSLWGKQTKSHERMAYALASYNAGRGRVLRSYKKAEYKNWSTVAVLLPKESRDYVHKIYIKYDFYKKHFIP